MKIIAHRGASGEFPENSLLAFEQAIVQGADGIELDVHFHHASKQFIVIHDAYVNKTTNGQGHYNDYSLEQLTQLALGENQYLVTLEQVLAHIAGRLLINIEIKTTSVSKADINQQLNLLNQLLLKATQVYGFTFEQFVLSSFNHPMILACKNICQHISTAALIAHSPLDSKQLAQQLHCQGVNQDIASLTENFVDDIHSLGLEVWVYTVDKLEDISICLAFGVDAIFTNFPKNSRDLLKICKEK